jgi:hypothetical protein
MQRLFQVVRSSTKGRIDSAIKLAGMLGIVEAEDSAYSRYSEPSLSKAFAGKK